MVVTQSKYSEKILPLIWKVVLAQSEYETYGTPPEVTKTALETALTYDFFLIGESGVKVFSKGSKVLRFHNKGTSEAIANERMTRVGRWMNVDEYNKMMKTGMVQEGGGGQTYAAFTKDGFMKQAASDAVYVEFDVPTSSFKVTNPDSGWIRFKSPLSVEGKLAGKKGLPIPQFPKAENIKLIGGK